jgi:hypothetical protein
MADWRIRHKDANGLDPSQQRGGPFQALHLERCQRCRIQVIEGPNGDLIDRETFERAHLKKAASMNVQRLQRFEKVFLKGFGRHHCPPP